MISMICKKCAVSRDRGDELLAEAHIKLLPGVKEVALGLGREYHGPFCSPITEQRDSICDLVSNVGEQRSLGDKSCSIVAGRP
jgi:hypothetical protein